MAIDATKIRHHVQRVWDDSIVPVLTEYIRIPAESPHYDTKWPENGHIDGAVALLQEWSVRRAIEGLHLEVVRLRTRSSPAPARSATSGGGAERRYGNRSATAIRLDVNARGATS